MISGYPITQILHLNDSYLSVTCPSIFSLKYTIRIHRGIFLQTMDCRHTANETHGQTLRMTLHPLRVAAQGHLEASCRSPISQPNVCLKLLAYPMLLPLSTTAWNLFPKCPSTQLTPPHRHSPSLATPTPLPSPAALTSRPSFLPSLDHPHMSSTTDSLTSSSNSSSNNKNSSSSTSSKNKWYCSSTNISSTRNL